MQPELAVTVALAEYVNVTPGDPSKMTYMEIHLQKRHIFYRSLINSKQLTVISAI